MQKFQILRLNLFSISTASLIPASVFASAESENIWLYITLIPVYLVLILQTLIVSLALVMKQFNAKQPVQLTVVVAVISMIIGLIATCYYETLENVWFLLKYFIPIGAIVIVLPAVQFKLMNKPENSSEEN